MYNLTNIQIAVLEVELKYFNTDWEHIDTESTYVVINSQDDRDYNSIIDDTIGAEINGNCKVFIYEARTASFGVELYKNGDIEFEQTGDIDTSTGYSGSAVFEKTFGLVD